MTTTQTHEPTLHETPVEERKPHVYGNTVLYPFSTTCSCGAPMAGLSATAERALELHEIHVQGIEKRARQAAHAAAKHEGHHGKAETCSTCNPAWAQIASASRFD